MTRRVLTAREQYALLTPWLPHRLNPDPSNPYDEEHYIPDRPRISWDPEEYHQERLPDVRWPRGQKPTMLYRGLHIDLDHPQIADHPNVQGMKQILYGDDPKNTLFDVPPRQGNLYPHPDSPEGKQLSNHVLNFVEDIGQNFDKHFEEWTPENERTRIPFSKIHDTYNPTWLGRHWTSDPEIADDFAKQPTPDEGHPPPKRGLSVMMEAGWDGRGEDLSRPNVGGDWGDESEINLAPGAELNVKGVHIRHPHMLPRATGGGDWHNVLSEPQKRTAGRKVSSMQPVILYTKPDCPQCMMTKKRLDHHGIPHQVVDVTTDPDAYDHVTNNLGYTSAPVVDAGNGNHWSGFRPDRIKGLLG